MAVQTISNQPDPRYLFHGLFRCRLFFDGLTVIQWILSPGNLSSSQMVSITFQKIRVKKKYPASIRMRVTCVTAEPYYDISGKAPLHLCFSPLTMSGPYVYSDSFQDDRDLCNILGAIRLDSGPPTVTQSGTTASFPARSDHVAASAANINTQPARSTASTAGRPLLATRNQAAEAVPGLVGKYQSIYFNDRAKIVYVVTEATPPAPVVSDGFYNVLSGTRTGIRETWYVLQSRQELLTNRARSCRPDAGDSTQGVPGGQVFKMQVTPPRRRRGRRCEAYVVFEGLAPGIYNTWLVLISTYFSTNYCLHTGRKSSLSSSASLATFTKASIAVVRQSEPTLLRLQWAPSASCQDAMGSE
jgi:hypothetical protein